MIKLNQSLINLVISGSCLLLFPQPSLTQIIPDATTNSIVLPNGNTVLIQGGTPAGLNLLHSFGEFNVLEGQNVLFTNPPTIVNILSRVTGSNPSHIWGTLGVLGNANLFLINPNGIVFGPNTTLALTGNFFGSTADAIIFNDGTEFSANSNSTPPLLTVSHPVALRFSSNNTQEISVNGLGHNLTREELFAPIMRV